MEEAAKDQPQKLYQKVETPTRYRLPSTFGEKLLKMHQKLLRVDSDDRLSLIDEKSYRKRHYRVSTISCYATRQTTDLY